MSKRKQTVENKGSNDEINITFPERVIVENIIPQNMIINIGCTSFDNNIPLDDVFDYHIFKTLFALITQSLHMR